MKVDSQAAQAYLRSRHIQSEPVVPHRNHPEIGKDRRSVQPGVEVQIKSLAKASPNVLTHMERSTLEALFGSHQKKTPEFYGNAEISALNKGNLLDIKG